MRGWKCRDEKAGDEKTGDENVGMKMRGWKCGNEKSGDELSGDEKSGGEKTGDENAGMKLWGWSVTQPYTMVKVEIIFKSSCWVNSNLFSPSAQNLNSLRILYLNFEPFWTLHLLQNPKFEPLSKKAPTSKCSTQHKIYSKIQFQFKCTESKSLIFIEFFWIASTSNLFSSIEDFLSLK